MILRNGEIPEKSFVDFGEIRIREVDSWYGGPFKIGKVLAVYLLNIFFFVGQGLLVCLPEITFLHD